MFNWISINLQGLVLCNLEVRKYAHFKIVSQKSIQFLYCDLQKVFKKSLLCAEKCTGDYPWAPWHIKILH